MINNLVLLMVKKFFFSLSIIIIFVEFLINIFIKINFLNLINYF
jgi:hypothetical protein